MRRRAAAAASAIAAAVAALVLAGCTAPPSVDAPVLYPRTAVFAILSECLRSSGSTVPQTYTVANGLILAGGFTGSNPNDPDMPQSALNDCLARYPVDAGRAGAPEISWLNLAYDYETRVLAPCLEAEGFTVPAPPSRAAYIGGEYWTAYQSVHEPSLGRLGELALACPPKPVYLRPGAADSR